MRGSSPNTWFTKQVRVDIEADSVLWQAQAEMVPVVLAPPGAFQYGQGHGMQPAPIITLPPEAYYYRSQHVPPENNPAYGQPSRPYEAPQELYVVARVCTIVGHASAAASYPCTPPQCICGQPSARCASTFDQDRDVGGATRATICTNSQMPWASLFIDASTKWRER